MKFRKNFKVLSAFLIAVNLILTGCGAAASQQDNMEETTQSQASHEESYNPVKGGTLRLAMRSPKTLNPLENEDVTVDNALKLIFEPLFNIDNNMNLTPNIAESITVSNTTVTIKVKDGITWSDGKAIGADDVVYSLDVIKDAPAGSIYKTALANVSSYEQTGDKTLNVYYSAPLGGAGYSFDFPIIPKHYYKGNDDADLQPRGCGSFELEEYQTGRHLILKSRNGLNGEPYISQIDVVVLKDEQTMMSSIENNIIDAVVIDAEDLGEIKGDITTSAKMFTSGQFEYAGFNTDRKIFSTADLRQAMVYLMPVDNIITGIYINNVTKSLTPINPESVYADMAGVDTYNNDTSTANTLILASGLTKDDFSFTILVNSENRARCEAARMLSDAFNAYGMNTKVEAVEFEEYKNRLSSGDFDMYLGGTQLKANMDVSQLVGSGGSINFTGYSNSTLDEYISRANASSDFESYKRSLNELNKILAHEVPVAGIGFKKRALVCSNRVKGDITPIYNNCSYNINKWFIVS